jgi:hypothetical protein
LTFIWKTRRNLISNTLGMKGSSGSLFGIGGGGGKGN